MSLVTKRHCAMELMKQVFPKLVGPGGICVPLCEVACLTPVSGHRLTEALEGTYLVGSSDVIYFLDSLIPPVGDSPTVPAQRRQV